MADGFAYTGYRRVFYFKYLDLQTGHTLVADPGGQYEIMATESGLPVPPGDGLWASPQPPLALPPSAARSKSKAVPVEEAPTKASEKAGE